MLMGWTLSQLFEYTYCIFFSDTDYCSEVICDMSFKTWVRDFHRKGYSYKNVASSAYLWLSHLRMAMQIHIVRNRSYATIFLGCCCKAPFLFQQSTCFWLFSSIGLNSDFINLSGVCLHYTLVSPINYTIFADTIKLFQCLKHLIIWLLRGWPLPLLPPWTAINLYRVDKKTSTILKVNTLYR